ncbi:hypothetical protein O181_104170 [Austropuccinia psidii MF-1]|uniref:Uncharacterized protein n=1 Tax=Austropuccinia psidii MF-1 TaxID=1389203 RepID=A0A9Q3PKF3_9BASI|nr:hypothetical protein [Austropuccinia psidii MF-1]
MTPPLLRDLGFTRNQPETRPRKNRARRQPITGSNDQPRNYQQVTPSQDLIPDQIPPRSPTRLLDRCRTVNTNLQNPERPFHMERDIRNVQKKQESIGKEIYYLYEKEEQEYNPFLPTKGDEAIINASQKVKDEDKPNNQDPSLRSESIQKDGENLSYSEKWALKKLPEVVNWPIFSGVGEYDHLELIHYIDGLFVDVLNIPDYWLTKRLKIEFRGHETYYTLK